MLDTPPEVRAAHRMRVKFLSGVKAGSISDIPSVAILPLSDSDGTGTVASATPAPTSTGLLPVSGAIRPGDTLRLLDDKAGFDWKVVQILPDGKLEVATTIFERPTSLTVTRERVQLLGRPPRPLRGGSRSVEKAEPERDSFDQSAWVSKYLSPDRPRRPVDIVAESIVLGPRCIASCRHRFYRGSSDVECADRFRAEIRMKGVIQRDRRRGTLEGRIRVHNRFELILPDDFRAGDMTTVEDPRAILDLRPRSRRRANSSKTKARVDQGRRRRRNRRKRPRPE